MSNKDYIPVIGLEIHIQLNTKRKMFCNCSNYIWKAEPNTHVCPVCLGLPGALPVPNQKAIQNAQIFGLSLGCKLNKNSNFDRKHYFYPDLPKGYQTSQYKKPFCYDGVIDLPQGKVNIVRVHLEEDTAKSIHDSETNSTLIDHNKSGVPLMELVTAPDIVSAEHAEKFARKIAQLAEFIGVSDVNMERGNLRVEPSISVKKPGQTELPNYKVELKNINSFKFMKDAINYEIKRQIEEHEQGNKIPQQTRGWNEKKKISVEQRQKEDEHEYRYFPEPDIPPFEFDEKYFKEIKAKMPKLPGQVVEEFVNKHNVDKNKVEELLRTNRLDEANLLVQEGLDAKEAVNIVLGANEKVREQIKTNPKQFADDYKAQKSSKVSDEGELLKHVQQVVKDNPKSVEDYKKGNENAVNFLLGQVMKATRGKADAGVARKLIVATISK
jgi:aspartyl-tRNA(Asn)/glutamyl-tRNA(Gln) amidotransferase subunit B